MINTIGRYEIKRELGRGGMAGVYEAHDPRFERPVAIKVLPRELMVDTMFRARFDREAKVIASLEHPGIVPVYDYGEDNGQPYLVMQYMPGGSLADRLGAGRMSLAETADLIARIAPAVDYANSRGVSHRDLKPANIVFDRSGEPRVADFGIARISESKTVLTQGVIGTPAYMSPEQWEGLPLDGRSDVYSMGVMAFEMLTGQTPYVAETMTGFMKAHLMDDIPDARARVPDLPVAVQQTLARALAKARAQRYETASDFARDLSAAAAGLPISAVAVAAPPPRTAAAPPLAPTQVMGSLAGVEPPQSRPGSQPGRPAGSQPGAGPSGTPADAGPTVVKPPSQPGRAASDSIVPVAPPARRGSPLAIAGVLAGIVVLGAIVALISALSGAGAAPPAATSTPAAIATATRAVVLADTPSPAPSATRVLTATLAPTTAATRAPTPTPYPATTPSLIQNCVGTAPAAGVFVQRGSCWRYNDTGLDLGAAWKESDFDDRAWSVGRAELGYGDAPTTTLSFGPDPNNKRVTAYFRQPFTIASLEGVSKLRLLIWRDDGVVIYLNGLEVARDNMPGSVITRSTFAVANIANEEETQPIEFILPVARLTAGTNVLAAEVHQDRADSSDIRFSLELSVLQPGSPTSTPRPTRTPTPAPTPCPPTNPFNLPADILAVLGCGGGDLQYWNYITQEFEHGYMLVIDRGDPANPGGGNVYAFINGGLAYRDMDTFKKPSEDPDSWYSCNAAPGLRPEQSGVPWRSFGQMWCKSAELRAALGGVKIGSAERFVTGGQFQGYQGGRALRLADRLVVFTSPESALPGLVVGRWR